MVVERVCRRKCTTSRYAAIPPHRRYRDAVDGSLGVGLVPRPPFYKTLPARGRCVPRACEQLRRPSCHREGGRVCVCVCLWLFLGRGGVTYAMVKKRLCCHKLERHLEMVCPSSHISKCYAHRGIHRVPQKENTLAAFRSALRRMDGFECDVRRSRDGIPIVVHDATLYRTHGVNQRVADMSAGELEVFNVPTLEDVLQLLKGVSGEKRAILDLKVQEREMMVETKHITWRIGVNLDQITFLVWNRIRAPLSLPGAIVLRAVESKFQRTHPHVDGFACKYTGDMANLQCIEAALDAGSHVNLWSSDPVKAKDMLKRYGQRRDCSLTVGR